MQELLKRTINIFAAEEYLQGTIEVFCRVTCFSGQKSAEEKFVASTKKGLKALKLGTSY